MDTILLANIINFIGIIFCNLAFTIMSFKDTNIHNIVYMIASVFIVIGSYMLKSYPIVLLNFLWFFICFFAYKKINYIRSYNIKHKNILYLIIGIGFLFLSLTYINIIFIDYSAYITTLIYIYGYILFSNKLLDKKHYLISCIAGFFLVFPHLLEKYQYSIMLNEVYGFFIGISGFYLLLKKEKQDYKKGLAQ